MIENVISGNGQQSIVLSPRAETFVKRTVDYVFDAEEPKSRIERALSELDPQVLGDLYPVLELALESLGQFYLGVESLQSVDFPEARDHFEWAARGFEQTGVTELRDLAAGLTMYIAAVVELQTSNVGRSIELFAQVRDYLQQAGRYGQQYQYMIDHIQPESLFVQGFQALMQSDFSTARTLIEQASQLSEKVAYDYYPEGTPGYQSYLGMSRFYRAQYTVVRAFNDFNRFKFDSLATEIGLTADAVQAREFLSKAGGENPLVVIATYLSRGHVELLVLIGQLAHIMQAVLSSTFQPNPEIYEALRQQIQHAKDSYAKAGPQSSMLVRLCDQLSIQVNNLERLAKPRHSLREEIALRNFSEFQKATLDSLQAPLTQLRWWSILTLFFVALSVLLILAGAASALFLNTEASVLTSISSLLTTLISSVLYFGLRQARKEVNDSRVRLLQEFNEASERYFENNPPPTASETNSS